MCKKLFNNTKQKGGGLFFRLFLNECKVLDCTGEFNPTCPEYVTDTVLASKSDRCNSHSQRFSVQLVNVCSQPRLGALLFPKQNRGIKKRFCYKREEKNKVIHKTP